jgi:type III pantothenate kinase
MCSWRAETRPEQTADEYASLLFDFFAQRDLAPQVNGVALVSVVPQLTTTFQQLARAYLKCEPFVVAPGVKSGVQVRYQDPRALGADRLVCVAAAKALYGAPALVIDFGTATTFNALDKQGDFVGGAIAPGLAMSAEALHRFTARLPLVELALPPRALAANTDDALRSGVVLGYIGLVEGLIGRLRAEMDAPQARVIATGGSAALLAPHCASIEIVEPLLTLYGLRLLYELNAPEDGL